MFGNILNTVRTDHKCVRHKIDSYSDDVTLTCRVPVCYIPFYYSKVH